MLGGCWPSVQTVFMITQHQHTPVGAWHASMLAELHSMTRQLRRAGGGPWGRLRGYILWRLADGDVARHPLQPAVPSQEAHARSVLGFLHLTRHVLLLRDGFTVGLTHTSVGGIRASRSSLRLQRLCDVC